MKLAQVKSLVYTLPTDGIVKDGIGISEPILSKEDGRLIDNYYTYALELTSNAYSGPISGFGICSDASEVVYTDADRYIRDAEKADTMYALDIEAMAASLTPEVMEEYEAAYESVRSFAFADACTDEQKSMLKKYLEKLDMIVLAEHKSIVRQIGSGFYAWADSIIG